MTVVRYESRLTKACPLILEAVNTLRPLLPPDLFPFFRRLNRFPCFHLPFPPFSQLTAIPPHSRTHQLAPTAVAPPKPIGRNPPGLLARLSRPHEPWPFFQKALAAPHLQHVPDCFQLSQFTLRHNDLLSSLRSSTHTSAIQHSLQLCRQVSCTRLQTIPCPYLPFPPIHLTIAGQLLNLG